MQIHMVFDGQPVPYVRMTQGSKWSERAQNYLGYQHALADTIRAKYASLILDPPPVAFRISRRKFLKEQADIYYQLSVVAFVECWGKRGDISNYTKTVEDAIQVSGIIFNDKQIVDSHGRYGAYENSDRPRVEFKLEQIK